MHVNIVQKKKRKELTIMIIIIECRVCSLMSAFNGKINSNRGGLAGILNCLNTGYTFVFLPPAAAMEDDDDDDFIDLKYTNAG